MMQPETHRQFYLGAAGIRMWYARMPLPGAAPSPAFVFPEPEQTGDEASAADKPVAGRSLKGRPSHAAGNKPGGERIASLQALMGAKAEPGPAVKSQKAPSAITTGLTEGAEQGDTRPARHSAQPVSVPRLDLGVFAAPAAVLVAHLSSDASLGLQESLAANILKALGPGQVEPARRLGWPAFNNHLVPGSSLSDLATVMQHLLQDLGSRKLVILGQPESGSGPGASDSWFAEAIERAPDVVFEHSLAELAANPALKRPLWQLLRPLVVA